MGQGSCLLRSILGQELPLSLLHSLHITSPAAYEIQGKPHASGAGLGPLAFFPGKNGWTISGSAAPSVSTSVPLVGAQMPKGPALAQPDLYPYVSQAGRLALSCRLVLPVSGWLVPAACNPLPGRISQNALQLAVPPTAYSAMRTHLLWRLLDFPLPELAE